jgi:hypothetical protein
VDLARLAVKGLVGRQASLVLILAVTQSGDVTASSKISPSKLLLEWATRNLLAT